MDGAPQLRPGPPMTLKETFGKCWSNIFCGLHAVPDVQVISVISVHKVK